MRREDSLERFGVMGVRQQQLTEQIRPLLKFYVAHPKAVNQSNAGALKAPKPARVFQILVEQLENLSLESAKATSI